MTVACSNQSRSLSRTCPKVAPCQRWLILLCWFALQDIQLLRAAQAMPPASSRPMAATATHKACHYCRCPVIDCRAFPCVLLRPFSRRRNASPTQIQAGALAPKQDCNPIGFSRQAIQRSNLGPSAPFSRPPHYHHRATVHLCNASNHMMGKIVEAWERTGVPEVSAPAVGTSALHAYAWRASMHATRAMFFIAIKDLHFSRGFWALVSAVSLRLGAHDQSHCKTQEWEREG